MRHFSDFCDTIHRRYAKLIQFALILTLSLLMTSCAAMSSAAPYVPVTIADGQILATAPGTTLYGIAQALTGQAGTSILMDPFGKVVMFTWPVPNVGVAWVQMQNTPSGWQSFLAGTQGKGSVANCDTWKILRGYLDVGKWVVASPAALNVHLVAELSAASTAVVTISTAGMPSIIMMPAFLIEDAIRNLQDLLHPTTISAIFRTS